VPRGGHARARWSALGRGVGADGDGGGAQANRRLRPYGAVAGPRSARVLLFRREAGLPHDRPRPGAARRLDERPPLSGINVRALVFRAVALLVVVNATAGIIVIVSGSGQVGSTEAHVLETTGLLSLAVLLLLPCVLAHETKRFRTLTFLPA